MDLYRRWFSLFSSVWLQQYPTAASCHTRTCNAAQCYYVQDWRVSNEPSSLRPSRRISNESGSVVSILEMDLLSLLSHLFHQNHTTALPEAGDRGLTMDSTFDMGKCVCCRRHLSSGWGEKCANGLTIVATFKIISPTATSRATEIETIDAIKTIFQPQRARRWLIGPLTQKEELVDCDVLENVLVSLFCLLGYKAKREARSQWEETQ